MTFCEFSTTIPGMRNITSEASHTIRALMPADARPPRGSDGCDCMEEYRDPDRETLVILNRSGDYTYMRMACPIHGPTISETESTT